MGIVYLDTSIALRTILDVPERARLQAWIDVSDDVHVSSRLLHTETIRALRRDGRPVSDATPMLSRVGLLDITRQTHVIAESFDRHVRTLDALHLATALLIGEPVTLATHDRAMASMALDLGLRVIDPVEEE